MPLSRLPPCCIAGWWFKPDFIINNLNINSAVARPWHDEVVPLARDTSYNVRGYAYAGVQGGCGLCGLC